MKRSKVSIKTRSTPASRSLKGQATKHTTVKWSIWRTGMKNFNAVSHNRARPYFQIQHGRGEVRACQVYSNVHSVTGNVVDTE